ncbi:MAG: YlxR family protein [Candidatus Nanopelagicales bacterium]
MSRRGPVRQRVGTPGSTRDGSVGPAGLAGVDSAVVGGSTAPSARPSWRTCVGCRTRADRPELVRVVMAQGACVPDVAARLPGRGAWLHRRLDCLDLAERRRALPRALRVPAPLDVSAVRDWLASMLDQHADPPGVTPDPAPPSPASSGVSGHEHPMNTSS